LDTLRVSLWKREFRSLSIGLEITTACSKTLYFKLEGCILRRSSGA
jgi:hypothetical protein